MTNTHEILNQDFNKLNEDWLNFVKKRVPNSRCAGEPCTYACHSSNKKVRINVNDLYRGVLPSVVLFNNRSLTFSVRYGRQTLIRDCSADCLCSSIWFHNYDTGTARHIGVWNVLIARAFFVFLHVRSPNYSAVPAFKTCTRSSGVRRVCNAEFGVGNWARWFLSRQVHINCNHESSESLLGRLRNLLTWLLFA